MLSKLFNFTCNIFDLSHIFELQQCVIDSLS